MTDQTVNEIHNKALEAISAAKKHRDGMYIGVEALQLIRNDRSTPDHIREIAVNALFRIAGSQAVDKQ